jgi:hypothetical protein
MDMGKEMITTKSCELLLDAFQFVVVTELQTTEAYGSFDVTKIKYNIYNKRTKGKCYGATKTQHYYGSGVWNQ